MSEEQIQLDKSDAAIVVLTLNRPEKRNALSIALIEQVRAAVLELKDDKPRRVLIIRGAGPAFCAGLDLKEAGDPATAHHSAEALAGMYEAIATSPLVTIAAAHGTAVGGGAGLVAACDFVVGSTDLKIGYPEVHRGLTAALVTTLTTRQLGERVVRELVLLGQNVEAERALRIGLINRVVEPSQLMPAAMELAREALRGAPGAVVRTKELLDALGKRTIAEDLRKALDFHLGARGSIEAQEGMKAFLEKRPPAWPPRP
jgi:methylglutaconyl-CoA hydratase